MNPATDETIDAALDDLRQRQAPQRDPLRWALIEALARRSANQPDAVRERLLPRLWQWIEALRRALAAAPNAAPAQLSPGPNPLTALLHDLGATPHGQPGTPTTPAADELKTLSGSKRTWARLRNEHQLQGARQRVPAQAGPLNSQRIVLDALQTLQQLSSDYTDALLAQLDALIWLDEAAAAAPAPSGAPPAQTARTARRRAPGAPRRR